VSNCLLLAALLELYQCFLKSAVRVIGLQKPRSGGETWLSRVDGVDDVVEDWCILACSFIFRDTVPFALIDEIYIFLHVNLAISSANTSLVPYFSLMQLDLLASA